jgi:hypothetical protein
MIENEKTVVENEINSTEEIKQPRYVLDDDGEPILDENGEPLEYEEETPVDPKILKRDNIILGVGMALLFVGVIIYLVYFK